MTRAIRFVGLLCAGLLVVGCTAWGALALLYYDPASPLLRQALAVAFGIAGLAALIALARPRWRWRGVGLFAALFALLLGAWSGLQPTNEADWQPEGARIASARIDGDQVTVHNVRNFAYRTETDFTPSWDDRTYDLRRLDGVDLVAVYWMGPAIAHVFLSFGFRDQGHLAISIEARKKRGQSYSSVDGFFRQYELQYVVADERDVIRLRTNYRRDPPEEAYLYRLQGSNADARRLFLAYLTKINSLSERPEFYNTLLANCTNNIWVHSLANPGHVPYSWKILASGHVPEYLYGLGKLDTSVPFPVLHEQAHINERAKQADAAADFSARIRAAPGPAAKASPAVDPAGR
ncbi:MULTISPECIES: DUF4105 domain-containing protein [Ramlibacter]|uniref:DUF4105 domain-containing protein n=1 Tax=Ramlibacter pinisoli TaxID=2682844 RepID=A0A6N8IV91_9BURK|nr:MULTISPECIES: DUF4105 domain-containing protein [Ramlibacter]MBA2960915.1 DUF4105 domain-containing protein [Ramlibacter sp. CGMCC 1.13660]MVQ30861.1 DUF4105 domain-containing protein [Ramlibacter pinisoli]